MVTMTRGFMLSARLLSKFWPGVLGSFWKVRTQRGKKKKLKDGVQWLMPSDTCFLSIRSPIITVSRVGLLAWDVCERVVPRHFWVGRCNHWFFFFAGIFFHSIYYIIVILTKHDISAVNINFGNNNLFIFIKKINIVNYVECLNF